MGRDEGLAEALAKLVMQDVLPLVPILLREEKPVPVWALKVVEECLEFMPEATIPALARYISCFATMTSSESGHSGKVQAETAW